MLTSGDIPRKLGRFRKNDSEYVIVTAGSSKRSEHDRLVIAGTIEDKIGELKARKQSLADALFEHDGKIGTALTEDDVTALLSA